jgi:hypothetical protein
MKLFDDVVIPFLIIVAVMAWLFWLIQTGLEMQ